MKRKYIKITLFAIGIVCVCVSLVLMYVSMASVNIIGGADWPTFFFIFFRKSGGLYSILTLLGLLSIMISIFFKKGEK